MDRFQRFIRILKAFAEKRVEYTLIGGVAVILHGFPRLTEDIDILLKADVQNIEKLKNALEEVFNDPSVKEIELSDLKNYSILRYGAPDGFYIDLITHLGEAADYGNVASEKINVEGVRIKVATAEALYRLKKESLRPKDQNDALFLKGKLEYLKKNSNQRFGQK